MIRYLERMYYSFRTPVKPITAIRVARKARMIREDVHVDEAS